MKKKRMKFKINSFVITSVVLFLILVVSLLTNGFGIRDRLFQGDKEGIGKKAVDFVNKNFLSNGITASLVSVSLDESGLYQVKLKVQDQEVDTYVSRDGSKIFFQGVEMESSTEADQNNQAQEQIEIPKADNPGVKLFVMAFCPYGNQAEDTMMPVVDLFKNKAKITLHYVIYSDYSTGYPDYCLDKENKYCSMHGIQELNQDIREICVQKYQKDKLWAFIKKINENATHEDVDKKWKKIAQEIGIDVAKIENCQENEAIDLLSREISLTSKKYEVQSGEEPKSIMGSPTLVINGIIYSGNRTPDAFKEAICSGFKTPPKECSTKLSDVANNTSTGGCE
jgi:SepF-like predicted cell division protein (DUF552 family)